MPAGGGAFPVIARREGERQRAGIILASPGSAVARLSDFASAPVGVIDLSLERRLTTVAPLAERAADVRQRVTPTGGMIRYAWTLDGRFWENRQSLRLRGGKRVVVDLVNRSGMAHPMHLHGHHIQVVAIDGCRMAGAVRDTVLVPVGATVSIAFFADNHGRWLLHCHESWSR